MQNSGFSELYTDFLVTVVIRYDGSTPTFVPDNRVFYTPSLATNSSRTMSPGKQLTPNQPTIPTTESTRVFTVRDGEHVSETVIRAVSEQDDVSLTNVEPLYERIDPDALDDFFDPTCNGRGSTAMSVEFDYAGHTVIARGSGVVELK